jgi:hypothetical protein
MSTDELLEAVAELQGVVDEERENLCGGLHLRLCAATMKVYEFAKALKRKETGGDDSDREGEEEDDEEEEGEESESDAEPERERTEDDMELNELSDFWEGQFDFGRPRAVLPIEGLIEIITMDSEEKRVCAAVRVLNRALHRSKPDDPADAERILQWKEALVEEGAIKECAEILQGDREFSSPDDDRDHWMHYSILCSEILELFTRLGEGDALFRTKLRRNGALKGAEEHVKRQPLGAGLPVLKMLRQR